jgi:hypothetical protein
MPTQLENMGRNAVKQHMDCARLANILDVTPRWLQNRVRAGEIRAVQTDCKLLIEVQSVNEYLERNQTKALEVPGAGI